jgi:hypothetical protein
MIFENKILVIIYVYKIQMLLMKTKSVIIYMYKIQMLLILIR